MRSKTIHYLLIVLSTVLCACYGLEDENFKTPAPIEVTGVDQVIYAKLAEPVILNSIKIKSDREVACEWSYGRIGGDFPKMADTTFLSNEMTIAAPMNRIGQYVLRLKADNGESIVFKYYELRVQSAFDEGILVLCNDAQEDGELTFIKKRSPQEEAQNAQEVYDNLFTINPEYRFTKVQDMFFFNNTSTAVSGLLVSTEDGDGSVYRLDPVTFETTSRVKMTEEYGTTARYLLGERTASSYHYCYIQGSDGRLFNYDILSDIPAYREMSLTDRVYQGYNSDGSLGRNPYLISENTLVGLSGRTPKNYTVAEGFEILSVAASRTGIERVVMICRRKDNPRSLSFTSVSGSFSGPSTYGAYTAAKDILMDENSMVITTKADPSNAYYSYDNQVYHWPVTNYVNPMLPVAGDRADITLPAGEQIVSMCTTGIPTSSTTTIDDDKLIIATYNPGAAGRKPGSVFVYNMRSMAREKEYVGVCQKPVKVCYKFAVSH